MNNPDTPSSTPIPSHLRRLAICSLLSTSCAHGEEVHIDTDAPCEVDTKCTGSQESIIRPLELEPATKSEHINLYKETVAEISVHMDIVINTDYKKNPELGKKHNDEFMRLLTKLTSIEIGEDRIREVFQGMEYEDLIIFAGEMASESTSVTCPDDAIPKNPTERCPLREKDIKALGPVAVNRFLENFKQLSDEQKIEACKNFIVGTNVLHIFSPPYISEELNRQFKPRLEEVCELMYLEREK